MTTCPHGSQNVYLTRLSIAPALNQNHGLIVVSQFCGRRRDLICETDPPSHVAPPDQGTFRLEQAIGKSTPIQERVVPLGGDGSDQQQGTEDHQSPRGMHHREMKERLWSGPLFNSGKTQQWIWGKDL